MHNEELNPRFWRDRFSQYLTSFPLSTGEWRAELKKDPMPGCGSVGFIVEFTCLVPLREKKYLEIVLPMKVVTGEARESLNLARKEIEDFLNSEEDWACHWNLG